MIHDFLVNNYRSFSDEIEFSFDENSTDSMIHPTVGIIGTNGAGKTNLLSALRLCVLVMQNSHHLEPNIPINCRPFSRESGNTTIFNLVFSIPNPNNESTNNKNNHTKYKYELKIEKGFITSENLSLIINETGDEKTIYRRFEDASSNHHVEFDVEHEDNEQIRQVNKNQSVIAFASQFSSQDHAIACQQIVLLGDMQFNEEAFIHLYSQENGSFRSFLDEIFDGDVMGTGIHEVSVATGVRNGKNVKGLFFKHLHYDRHWYLNASYQSEGIVTLLALLYWFELSLTKGAVLVIDNFGRDFTP